RESDTFGIYNINASEWDALCHDVPYLLPFKSSGNDRTDGPPAEGANFQYYNSGWLTKTYNSLTDPFADNWDDGGFDTISDIGNAKNIMTVGSVEDAVLANVKHLPYAAMAAYSCWGPTDDGRIKPDIVANGASLYSSSSASDTSYVDISGTSMSSPSAAGSAVLLAEYYSDLLPGRYMRSSTVKGLIIQTADDLGNAGPDYKFGWGLMNTRAAADHIYTHERFPNALRIYEDMLTSATPQKEFQLSAVQGQQIKVTLCWTDPPATPQASLDNPSPRLVNDLDLRIVDNNGHTNFPFVLNPTNPALPAVTGDNNLDNVEQVYIATATNSGVYTVRISADGSLDSGIQIFSLIVDGLVSPPNINHVPLQNTIQTNGMYDIAATITSLVPLSTNDVWVYWTTNTTTNTFQSNVFVSVSNDLYTTDIPAQPEGTTISYYITASAEGNLSTTNPLNAPAILHSFIVTPIVNLMITGSPGEIGTVDPDYGVYSLPTGIVITTTAIPFAPETNGQRYTCSGWTGTGNVPSSSTSNTVTFVIDKMSSVEWQWTMQYSLHQTSDPAGILSTTTWWNTGTSAETITTAPAVDFSGTNYHFAEWHLDGSRLPNATNVAENPATGINMTTQHTANAIYLPAGLDADIDGLPDWWERFFFGSLSEDSNDDTDGDGYLNLEEYQDQSNPRVFSSTPAGPTIIHTPIFDPQLGPAPWQITAVITDNCEVAVALLRWRRNGLNWRQNIMQTNGTPNLYIGEIAAPGIMGDTFEYRIEATDSVGYFIEEGPHSFYVTYPIATITPETVSMLLLTGTVSNTTLVVTNSGNTNLSWSTLISSTGFIDDINSTPGGWTHTGNRDLWHITTNRSFSTNFSWYCGYDDTRHYEDDTDASLITPPILLANDSILTFHHWAKMELDPGNYAWDGGTVEISENNGVTYSQIFPEGGYPFLIVDNAASPFAPDTPCFAGTGKWENAQFDLSAYSGKEVRIRFRFGADAYINDEGWYIDNVAITPGTVTNSWLLVSPTNGVLSPAASTNVTVTVDSAPIPSGMDVGALLRFISNDPVTPDYPINISLSVRSIPEITITATAQTSTNGEGYVSINSAIYDPDEEICQLEIGYSIDAGNTWTNAWIQDVLSSLGSVIISNTSPRQILNIKTSDGADATTNMVDLIWSSTNSPILINLSTQTLVSVRVWDGLFWSHSVTSKTFMVDNEPPSIPAFLTCISHTTNSWGTNTVMELSWGASSDGAGAGVTHYRCTFTDNSIPYAPYESRTTNLWVFSAPLEDGSNRWSGVRAIDVFGNVGTATNIGPFMIDSHPPSITGAVINTTNSDYGDYILGADITCSWSGFNDHASGIAGYYYGLTNNQGTTNGRWTTNISGLLSNALLNATNTVFVWGRDNVGWIGFAASSQVLALSSDGDFDQDNMNNQDEEIAGTDAADTQSFFGFDSINTVASTSNNIIVVEWNSIAGRSYSLYTREWLDIINVWQPINLFTNIPGTGDTLSYTGSMDGANSRFYQITVTKP
ncbi:MAG: S8 family serine peptidase, partial [Kiritimatiellae bacterium]|nr:S8 family serine peptidase [Kiritimatiellia bacterium]